MKKTYKWFLYITTTLLVIFAILFMRGKYYEAVTHTALYELDADGQLVVVSGAADSLRAIAIRGYAASFLCILALVLCWFAIHKKFKNDDFECNHIKLKIFALSIINVLIILFGISLLILIYNH